MTDRPDKRLGVMGEVRPGRSREADARYAVRVWRMKMAEGRASMIEYLDAYRGGVEGFAKDLARCAASEDPRASTAALKLEAQLRTWLDLQPSTEVHVDQRRQSVTVDARQVHVGMPAEVREWLEDPEKRKAARLLGLSIMEGEDPVEEPDVGGNGQDVDGGGGPV